MILAEVRTSRDVLVRLDPHGDAAPGGGVGAVAGEGDGGESAASVEETGVAAAVAVGTGERCGVGVDVGDGEISGGRGFGEGQEGADVAGEGVGLVEDAHFAFVVGLFGKEICRVRGGGSRVACVTKGSESVFISRVFREVSSDVKDVDKENKEDSGGIAGVFSP